MSKSKKRKNTGNTDAFGNDKQILELVDSLLYDRMFAELLSDNLDDEEAIWIFHDVLENDIATIRRMAQNGNTAAMTLCAFDIISDDAAEGMSLLAEAAEQGCAVAHLLAAMIFLQTDPTPEEHKDILHHLSVAMNLDCCLCWLTSVLSCQKSLTNWQKMNITLLRLNITS